MTLMTVRRPVWCHPPVIATAVATSPVSLLAASSVYAFHQSGSRNKYQIAASIAEKFPELRRKLPTKRKAYQPERYDAIIFDAVALVLTHRSHCEVCIPPTTGS